MKNKILPFVLIITLFISCRKEEILEVTENSGKMYGYSIVNQTSNAAVASFGIVNTNDASSTPKSTIPRINSFTTQAMYLPTGEYIVPVPWILVKASTPSKLIMVDTKTFKVDSIVTNYTTPIVAPVYSPVNQKTYAILRDTLFSFGINRASTPKALSQINRLPGLNMRFSSYQYSMAAHGKLPYLYIAAGGTLRRYDVNTNTYTTIFNFLDNKILFYGIVYNPFDGKIYFTETYSGLVVLVSLDPATNKTEQVVEIFKGSISYEAYATTLHCCENKYSLFTKRQFHNIDLTTKTIKIVPSALEYQGLIWAN
jgi:hypothetical protein